MNPEIRRYGIPGLVFLGGLLAGTGFGQFGNDASVAAPASRTIAADSEIVSILDDEVMSLSYRTAALDLVAQRSSPGGLFALQVTFADGRKPQQCLASPDLGGLLPSFSTITVQRQIEAQSFAVEFPQLLGSLEIRDRIIGESPPLMVFRTTSDRTAVAASFDAYAAELALSISDFVKLEGGCNTLAER